MVRLSLQHHGPSQVACSICLEEKTIDGGEPVAAPLRPLHVLRFILLYRIVRLGVENICACPISLTFTSDLNAGHVIMQLLYSDPE